MNTTPNSNRLHIGIFGKTNSGKSSILNAIVGQDISIVSNVSGTTTDSVKKSMEFLPYGPVLFIDTAGFEDNSILGNLRMEKSLKELRRTDLALFIVDSTDIDIEFHEKQKKLFKRYNTPYITIFNKIDLIDNKKIEEIKLNYPESIFVSTKDMNSILNLKQTILEKIDIVQEEPKLIGDIVPYGSSIIMVVPIDSEAPKGRIILPQVQLIRECLDSGIMSYVVRDTELEESFNNIKNVDLVVTDSQAFKEVEKIVAGRAKLTSFSILFARQKGDLKIFIDGIKKLKELKDGDKILIAETCTHNTSHEDIGRVKIPKLLKKYTGKDLIFKFCGGKDYPDNLTDYNLVIHCGGCMINSKEMKGRILEAINSGVSITNYGLVLAEVNGILESSLEIFKNKL